MTDISNELKQVNKDEEFHYFNNNLISIQTGKSAQVEFKSWSSDEHIKFTEAIKLYDPTDIDSITKHIGTRTSEQVTIHLKIYRNYCNRTSTTVSNPFLSNISNNLFMNLIDQLGKDPNYQGIHNPSSSSSPTMATTTTTTTTTTSPTASTASSPTTRSGKISLHLASHTIPVSIAKPASSKKSNNINANLEKDSKLKKNQKLLNEPWSEEDQKKLEEALVKFPSSRYSSVSRWQVISKELGISPKTVALRYNQMLISLLPKNKEETSDPSTPLDDDEDEDDETTTKGKRKGTKKQTRTSKRGKKDVMDDASKGLPPLPIINTPPKPQSPPKEKTIHHLNFDPEKADSLITRNNSLIDQIRNDIIYTGTTKVDLLTQYKNNINEALKSTMIWSDDGIEMPPLPVKINDMIFSIMSTMSNKIANNNPTTTTTALNTFTTASITSGLASSGKWGEIPKHAVDWYLPIDNSTQSKE